MLRPLLPWLLFVWPLWHGRTTDIWRLPQHPNTKYPVGTILIYTVDRGHDSHGYYYRGHCGMEGPLTFGEYP